MTEFIKNLYIVDPVLSDLAGDIAVNIKDHLVVSFRRDADMETKFPSKFRDCKMCHLVYQRLDCIFFALSQSVPGVPNSDDLKRILLFLDRVFKTEGETFQPQINDKV